MIIYYFLPAGYRPVYPLNKLYYSPQNPFRGNFTAALTALSMIGFSAGLVLSVIRPRHSQPILITLTTMPPIIYLLHKSLTVIYQPSTYERAQQLLEKQSSDIALLKDFGRIKQVFYGVHSRCGEYLFNQVLNKAGKGRRVQRSTVVTTGGLQNNKNVSKSVFEIGQRSSLIDELVEQLYT